MDGVGVEGSGGSKSESADVCLLGKSGGAPPGVVGRVLVVSAGGVPATR